MASFDAAIDTILTHEGHLSLNDPVDPGGDTAWGISIRYLRMRGDLDKDGWLDGDIDHDGDIDRDDILKLTLDAAKHFYLTGFWRTIYNAISAQDIATKILDISVNAGHGVGHKVAQRALRALHLPTTVDGRFGVKTLGNIERAEPKGLEYAMRSEQARFYAVLIAKKPRFRKYERGWMRRAYDEF